MTQNAPQIQSNPTLVAAIDAGGTSFKCLVATTERKTVAQKRIETASPDLTLRSVADFFRSTEVATNLKISSIGIASFGPIDVDPKSEQFGTILNTPKADWADTDLRDFFHSNFSAPVNIDTDVNGALIAESKWGAAMGHAASAYVTVGTGIGVGIQQNGILIGKPTHPEFGHIRVQRHPRDDANFSGLCPFHGDCLEGVTSAPALWDRFGDPAKFLPEQDCTIITGYYLAQLCIAISSACRTSRIVMGGGVMKNPHIFKSVQSSFAQLNNGYLPLPDDYIARPKFGDDAGQWGGFALGLEVLPSG